MDIQSILKLPQIQNLTGGQIVEILNNFLYGALSNIFIYSNWGKKCCANVLSLIDCNKRRKLSGDRQELLDGLYNTVMSSNKNCFDYYKSCKIERAISFKILCKFLDDLKGLDISESENSLNIRQLQKYNLSEKYAGITYIKAQNYQKLYLKFKDMVMQKYYLLAYKNTINKYNSANVFSVDIDDLFKTLVIAISVGIDKYREDKGSLSSFIQWQFKHFMINPSFDYEYGQSYSINKALKIDISKENKKCINNFAYEIDDTVKQVPQDELTIEESLDVIDFIKRLKKIKDLDFVIEVLGLDDYLNEYESRFN